MNASLDTTSSETEARPDLDDHVDPPLIAATGPTSSRPVLDHQGPMWPDLDLTQQGAAIEGRLDVESSTETTSPYDQE